MAIEVGFKPPAGKFWTREMFMPGYQAPESYDWRAEKHKLSLVGKRPDAAEIKAQQQQHKATLDRFRQAAEATARGASKEEIRLIMEA